MAEKQTKKNLIRDHAEQDLEAFIRLVHPGCVLGPVHSELIQWWTRKDAKSHQLALIPRDHQKSRLLAYRAAWNIVRNPAIRILYISSTAKLATKQLKFIKDILTSPRFTAYWPEYIKPNEGDREKWTETEISIDHPKRREENVRDPTVFTAGLTTNIVGMHCDVACLDDIVTDDNAYTQEGRETVERAYSYLASIEGTEAEEWTVGTRYFPRDLYFSLVNMKVELFDNHGQIVSDEPLYEKFERAVEDIGDGTGKYLWPRQQRDDGKWFGFDQTVLAKKRAAYIDQTQFRAQYYNNPNSITGAGIKREHFQYYDRAFVSRNKGYWYYKHNRLNVFAAIDFAYSLTNKADYSTIVVVGVDGNRNYYILDMDRFKTNDIGEYFNHILRLHQKWDFRKIRCEITAGQAPIVEEIKKSYVKPYGLALSVDEFRPDRRQGSKEERIYAILQPRYSNKNMWHYEGGIINVLEDELLSEKPPHDDVKDALSMAVDVAIAPAYSRDIQGRTQNVVQFNSRFGGFTG